jgi:hypothetical protein
MKKFLMLSVAALIAVGILAFGATSWAYAQDGLPVCPFCGEQQRMGGRGGFQGQGYDGEYGPLHDDLLPALAEAFGLTPAELEAAHADGKTLWQIAQDQGKTFAEFQALVLEARTQAFEQMVADGVITQEQADWMLERMGGRRSGGFGQGLTNPEGCGMYGAASSAGYGMRGGRWNNQP